MMPDAQKRGRASVLIVDDSAENRLLLASQLKTGSDYEIHQASDGVDGIERVKELWPDLILLDVMMPRMNGFEVCEHLKKDPATAAIPIIMVTALRDVQYKVKGIEAGADEFLSRPHHREELLVRVRSLIQLKRARERLEEERNRLELLYNVSRATTAKLDLDQMMMEIITHTQAAVGAAKGSIILLDNEGAVKHKVRIRRGLSPEINDKAAREILSEGWAGWLVRHNRGDIIEDVSTDARWIKLPDEQTAEGSAIGVPLSRANQVAGVLILTHPQIGYFRASHLSLLETIGAQLTAVIENAFLFNEIKEQRGKLQAILSQTNDGIIATDEMLNVTMFNGAAEPLFHVPAGDVIGGSLRDIDSLHVLVPLFERAKSQPVTQELAFNPGQTIYVSISPIKGVGYVAVMQDITEMKRIEELRLSQERREKQLVKDTFMRYMGPRLVEEVLSNEPGLLAQRRRRVAVVMFADLRGFTRMIVNVDPDTAIQMLNDFFTNMTDIVHEFDGTIFDLAGDELMVGFNVPFDQEDAAYRSILTAVTMQHRFDQLRRNWSRTTGTILGLGIGIDQGSVVVGNVGAESRMNFAMVGEAVNTSHRLVDMAEDGQIIVSEDIHNAVAERSTRMRDMLAFEPMGEISIRGKTSSQRLYQLQMKRTPLS